MSVFIQAVVTEPNTGEMDCEIKISEGTMTPHQTLKGTEKESLNHFTLLHAPVIKSGCFRDIETRHELAMIKLNCLSEGGGAIQADLRGWMSVGVTFVEYRMEVH